MYCNQAFKMSFSRYVQADWYLLVSMKYQFIFFVVSVMSYCGDLNFVLNCLMKLWIGLFIIDAGPLLFFLVGDSILIDILCIEVVILSFGVTLSVVPAEKKGDSRSRNDRDADNQQLMQLEEKDVVSSVAIVLSDLCGPGEWMPMEKLHAEVSI